MKRNDTKRMKYIAILSRIMFTHTMRSDTNFMCFDLVILTRKLEHRLIFWPDEKPEKRAYTCTHLLPPAHLSSLPYTVTPSTFM